MTCLHVINPPVPDDSLGLVKAHEPVLVKIFIMKLAVEALQGSLATR